jgi:hypothetical protein
MPGDKIERQNIFSAEGKRMPPAERPMKYTGVRAERYATIRLAGLAPDVRRDAIKKLNTQERRAVRLREKREAAAVERERLREAEERRQEVLREAERRRRAEEVRIARNARRRERRENQRINANMIVDIERTGGWDRDARDGLEAYLYGTRQAPGVLRRLVGQKKIYMQIAVDGVIVKNTPELYDIRGNDAEGIYWESIHNFITEYVDGTEINRLGQYGEDGDYEAFPENARVRFIILVAQTIPSGRIQQMYLDGSNHCVLDTLATLWRSMAENSESDGSMKRCFQIARRLEGLKTTYPDGVPEGMDMEAVARVAHRCIVIHDIVGNEIKRYNDRSPKKFYFTNTRINHLEAGRLTMDKQYERITAAEIMKILREHDKDDVFYLWSGCMKTGICSTLRSVRGCWAVFNEDYDLFKEFSETLGINNYGVDAVKHSSLNEFLLESRVINSAPTPLCDNPDDLDGVIHVDVEKAYTQHRFAPVYRGFLGHITDYVKLPYDLEAGKFLENHVGVYKFSVLNTPCALLQTLGIKKGLQYVLPSVEIEYFMKMGLEVRLIAGAWGSTFDIEYNAEMLKDRRYCIWAGKLGMDKCNNTYTFKGDIEWARCLRDMLGEENVLYFGELGMISVCIPKKGYKTRHHILAFITSYTRMNLLATMQKVEGTLVKVVLDGLYFRGELPDIELPIHKDKEKIIHKRFREHWYYPSTVNTADWEAYNEKIDTPHGYVRNVCVLTGAGGTGKSHSVLMRKSIPRVLYVVPSNVLGRKMREKWGVEYTTIHKLIGIDSGDFKCRAFREDHYEPAVIFIDELTMIDKSWIEKALAMYPNTRFYIAGDVDGDRWYQCRNGHPGKFSEIWLPTDVIVEKFELMRPMDCPGYEFNPHIPGEVMGYCLECKTDLYWDIPAYHLYDTQICVECYTPENQRRLDIKYSGCNPVRHRESPKLPRNHTDNKYYYCVEYTVDYRSKDEELKAFKVDVRREMREVFTDGGQLNANRVASYVRKNYATVPFADAVKMFASGDVWIAGTHKTNQKLLDAGVISGYFNKQKEIVAEGDGEARGSFTTHSFQGLTLETERVFVSLDFFEYAMLYTSISRVCRMSQLVIVN